MTTQEKREFNLTLTLESNEIVKFIKKMDPNKFVSMHQDCFKNSYLSEPEIILDNNLWEDLYLYDIVPEKYREFFQNMGLEEAYKWLNKDSEDFSMDMIKYELGLIDNDELGEECYDAFSELYFEYFSELGLSQFVIEVVEKYYEYMNELSLVKQ